MAMFNSYVEIPEGNIYKSTRINSYTQSTTTYEYCNLYIILTVQLPTKIPWWRYLTSFFARPDAFRPGPKARNLLGMEKRWFPAIPMRFPGFSPTVEHVQGSIDCKLHGPSGKPR
jgi:hypothetical protein